MINILECMNSHDNKIATIDLVILNPLVCSTSILIRFIMIIRFSIGFCPFRISIHVYIVLNVLITVEELILHDILLFLFQRLHILHHGLNYNTTQHHCHCSNNAIADYIPDLGRNCMHFDIQPDLKNATSSGLNVSNNF